MRSPAAIAALVLAAGLQTGCGLIIDGAYLIGGPRYRRDVEQRRPTAESQADLERDVRFEERRLVQVCEEVTRGIDRVWNVQKTYEYQGGIYQAHWLPILLEGLIGAATTIGVGLKCNEPGSDLSCKTLYFMIPLGVDVAYSVVRLLTIDKPKLVDKQASPPHTEAHPEPLGVRRVPCGPALLALGASANDPLALRLPFNEQGTLSAEDQQRALSFLSAKHAARVLLVPEDGEPVEARTRRCELLREVLAQGNPSVASGIGPECPAPALAPR